MHFASFSHILFMRIAASAERKTEQNIATLINQGTLSFTPASGTQQSLVSNTTTTQVSVTYGLEVSHAATRVLLSVVKNAPATAEVGDSISYQFTIVNTFGTAVTLDSLTDALPEGFSFTTATLTVDEVEIPLTAGTDYTVNEQGVFVFDPTAQIMLPAGGTAVLTLNGVVTA
ncbi:MAG: hypothetical protein E7650_05595 [Ruminococcaceae bacterium]|nr:hypothetical protein [Oscillospiraceae bacterium]